MRRNHVQTLILIVVLLPAIILLVANIWYYDKLSAFLKTNAMLMLNFFVVISVSFWLVQRNTEQRKKREIIDSIINKCGDACAEYWNSIEALISNSDNMPYIQKWRKMLTTKQKFDNYLALLDEYEMGDKYIEKLKIVQEALRKASLLIEGGLAQQPEKNSPPDSIRFFQEIGIVETSLTALRIALYK